MKLQYLFFLFLGLHYLPVNSTAQYQVGQMVNDTIYYGGFSSLDNCSPEPDVTIEVDQAILSYVTGLELKFIITDINAPEGSISNGIQTLEVGDTFEINTTEYLYPFYFSEGGDFSFILLATGVPEVEGEVYPCGLFEFITQVICENGYVIVEDEFAGSCEVEEGILDGLTEINLESKFDLFPNPNRGKVVLKNKSQYPIEAISIFDSQGKLLSVCIENISGQEISLDWSENSRGIFWIRIQTKEGQTFKKVFSYR